MSAASKAVEVTEAVAGSGFAVIEKKFSGYAKAATVLGIGGAFIIWYCLAIAGPQQDFEIKQKESSLAEQKLDNEAKRANDRELVKTLVETSAANTKLSAAVDKFTSAYEQQVQINKEIAETNKRQVEATEKANRLLETIKDDQRRGAWRDDDSTSKKSASNKTAKSQ